LFFNPSEKGIFNNNCGLVKIFGLKLIYIFSCYAGGAFEFSEPSKHVKFSLCFGKFSFFLFLNPVGISRKINLLSFKLPGLSTKFCPDLSESVLRQCGNCISKILLYYCLSKYPVWSIFCLQLVGIRIM